MTETIEQASPQARAPDPTEAVEDLLRALVTHREGLSSREAQRRLAQHGPNELQRRGGVGWPRELARQVTHPLALLLWAAALLSVIAGNIMVGVAVVLIIVLNAAVAFMQERHPEKAVEALSGYIPGKLSAKRVNGKASSRGTSRMAGTVVPSSAWHGGANTNKAAMASSPAIAHGR